jgi:hypothetical protein
MSGGFPHIHTTNGMGDDMTTQAPHTDRANGMAGPTRLAIPGGGQEVYEQLLALADKLGAACVEAYQQIGAAYADAYQKFTFGIGGLQNKLADQDHPAAWYSAFMPSNSPSDRMADAAERTLSVGDNLTDMGVKIGLACLDACEQATLAAATCHEQLGAASGSDLLRCTTAARAELARKVTRASAEAFRNIVA